VTLRKLWSGMVFEMSMGFVHATHISVKKPHHFTL